MQFTANEEALSKVIRACSKAGRSASIHKAELNIGLRVNGKKLTVTAADNARIIQRNIVVEKGENGACRINAKKTLTILSAAKRDMITASLSAAGLLIESEHVKALIPTYAGEIIEADKIWPDEAREKNMVYVNSAYLCQAIQGIAEKGAMISLDVPNDAEKPILVRAGKDGDDRALIMPIRVQ